MSINDPTFERFPWFTINVVTSLYMPFLGTNTSITGFGQTVAPIVTIVQQICQQQRKSSFVAVAILY
jgi:hypothetical protein